MNIFSRLSALFDACFQALESSAWEAERRREEAFLSQASSLEELENLQRQWARNASRHVWAR